MNNDNLKSFTKENAKEFGRLGGIASGKARTELSTMKKQLKHLLSLPVTDTTKKRHLQETGFEEEEIDNKLLLTYSLFEKAINGDLKAFAMVQQIISETDKEKFDFDLF